ncbi:MAG: hypothetical protein H6751_11845 [Candidatus Omnitrophica bacterium]|nr:hypothetical protein [Candidatus Omnitrophota bacterium]
MKPLWIAILFLQCQLSFAMFAEPKLFPADRLAKSLLEAIKEKPKDAENFYRLGRVYYLAFHNQSYLVPAYWDSDNEKPEFTEAWRDEGFERWARWNQASQNILSQRDLASEDELSESERGEFYTTAHRSAGFLEEVGWEPERIEAQLAIDFAEKAVRSFEYAIQLNLDNGLYRLGLASVQEEAADFLQKNSTSTLNIPRNLSSITKDQIYNNYLQAFVLSEPEDRKLDGIPPGGLEAIVSAEAARACLRLGPQTNEEQRRFSDHIKKLESIKSWSITPILITPPNLPNLSPALAPDTHVSFDIEGFGREAKWPWVKPETGILVWDPLEEGKIESGRQLFGNYTWQIFWRDGFEPLQRLDDDSNGALEGNELEGLAVWHDRNSDGVSDRTEVETVRSIGVKAIHVDGIEGVDSILCRRGGVLLDSGEELDLWDWMVEPLALLHQTDKFTHNVK